MRFVFWSILVMGVLFGANSTAYSKPQPVVLQQSSSWNLNYGETKCRLVRSFGDGKDKHYLILDQHYPSTSVGMTVAGPAFRRFKTLEETSVGFADLAAPRTQEPLKGRLGDMRHALVFSNVTFGSGPVTFGIPGLNTDIGNDANYLSLTQKGREVRFETGPLAPAFEALNTCTKDMVRSWGFDVEEQMTVVKRPVFKNVTSVARRLQQSYPNAAVRAGVNAILEARVTIDENGAVEECFLNGLTNTDRLKSTACTEFYERAEFEPALNVAGEPVRSFYTVSITYRIR